MAVDVKKLAVGQQTCMALCAIWLVAAVYALYSTLPTPYNKVRQTPIVPSTQYIAVDMNNQPTFLKSMKTQSLTRQRAARVVNAYAHHAAQKPAARKIVHQKQPKSTGALAHKIIRTLVLDEVDTFVQRANMVREVGQHLAR